MMREGGGYQPVGGQKAADFVGNIEMQAKKYGGIWKVAFFTCACCVTAAGTLSIFVGIMEFLPPFDFVNFVYLTLFGLIMMVIDSPIENGLIRNFKNVIFHYALFMTRFVGRGGWYLFLAAMTVGALWDNSVSPLLGFFLGGWIGGVAIASLVYGIQLSLTLEAVRKKVLEQGPEKWGAYIPPSGMTKTQFKEMAVALKGTVFTEEQLNYIVAAFSFEVRSDDIISRDEFEEWCRGPTMLVL